MNLVRYTKRIERFLRRRLQRRRIVNSRVTRMLTNLTQKKLNCVFSAQVNSSINMSKANIVKDIYQANFP